MKELEFTGEQIQRIDEIENTVFYLCRIMLEDPNLEWNMEIIGEVAYAVTDILVKKGHRVRYPSFVSCSEDGDELEIIDYIEPKESHNEGSVTVSVKLCEAGTPNKNKRNYSIKAINDMIDDMLEGYVADEETIKVWMEKLPEKYGAQSVSELNKDQIEAELDGIDGTISNEQIFALGTTSDENLHLQNIKTLLEYQERLEEYIVEKIKESNGI